MAKFLPFITTNSTPIYIFNTLITRSKGMNMLTVMSMFNLLISTPIEEIRSVSKNLPESKLENLYDLLLEHFSSARVKNSDFHRMLNIGDLVKYHSNDDITEKLREYDIDDIMGFFLVMALNNKLIDYTSLPFDNMINGKSYEVEGIVDGLKLFSNSGKPLEFYSKEALAAYIHYHALLNPKSVEPVKVIFLARPVPMPDEDRNKVYTSYDPAKEDYKPDPRGKPDNWRPEDMPGHPNYKGGPV